MEKQKITAKTDQANKDGEVTKNGSKRARNNSNGPSISKKSKPLTPEPLAKNNNSSGKDPKQDSQTTEDYVSMVGVPTCKDLPFYINELICYPKEETRPYIVNFRQILYENLLQELDEPKTIKTAFMTTFGFESKLLSPFASFLDKFLLINEANSTTTKIERDYSGIKNWTLLLSGKPDTTFGSGAYHPKLWLFKFPTFLRVVIGSGNLTIGDWTAWSNCLWFKDMPIKGTSDSDKTDNASFKNYLKFFLENIIPEVNKCKGLERLKKDADIDLDDYHYYDVFYELIGSCPGVYNITDDENCYGFNRLANVMKNYPHIDQGKKFDIKKKRVTYQTSSLGSVDGSLAKFFINSLYPTESKTLSKEDYPKLINIIFPTMKYIEDSPFDKNFACCLFLNTETYEKQWFIRDAMRKFETNPLFTYNDGVIPHLKIMIVTDDDYEIDDNTIIYFGSHNCTRSAWGKLEKGNTQISLSNTELGVIYPAIVGSAATKKSIVRSFPFKFPPEKLSKDEKPFLNDVFFNRRKMF